MKDVGENLNNLGCQNEKKSQEELIEAFYKVKQEINQWSKKEWSEQLLPEEKKLVDDVFYAFEAYKKNKQ